jgi:hypothetical protein
LLLADLRHRYDSELKRKGKLLTKQLWKAHKKQNRHLWDPRANPKLVPKMLAAIKNHDSWRTRKHAIKQAMHNCPGMFVTGLHCRVNPGWEYDVTQKYK